MYRLILAAFLTLFPLSSQAQSAASRDDYLLHCRRTPPNRAANYPGVGNVAKSNNLALPAGKSIPAPGQFVYFTGRVFDERCVPLADARVELWQANSDGQYIFPERGAFANPYPLFAGSGEAFTDGEGRFTFYTIFPGAEKNRAPHLNLRVTHRNTRDLFATMYFAGDARNDTDISLRRVPEDLKSLMMGQVEPYTSPDGRQAVHVHYDITVAGKDSFRDF